MNASGNPGRSGHKLSLTAGGIVAETRLLCSRFFHAENPESIIFCFNATDALNLAIHGSVEPGDHVITSSLEHNSVARPLEHLKDAGRREWFAGLTVVAVPYLPHVPIVAFEVIVEVCYEHG